MHLALLQALVSNQGNKMYQIVDMFCDSFGNWCKVRVNDLKIGVIGDQSGQKIQINVF